MVKSNPLVSKFMKARYYLNSDIFNASLGSNPSYFWRSLVETQVMMKRRMRKRTGNSLTITIWKVPWLPNLEDGYLTTELHEPLQCVKVQNLFDESQKSWDVEVIPDLFNDQDAKLILQIPIPLHDKEDSWYWVLDDKGLFTVKSCYRKFQGEYPCVDRIWNLKLPWKMINFLWRACSNVLPTAMALQSKRVNISS